MEAPDAGKGHGRVTLRFDDETPYVIWFDEEIRRSPAEFDRFGLFNIARFGTRVEMYLGDLTVNGQKLDLSQDPHWEGRNNESRYTEPNFHGDAQLRLVADELGRREARARSGACSGGPSRPTRSARTTATTWES